MNVGKLNKRIKFLKFEKVQDGAGGFLDNWETEEGWKEIASVWANIRPLKGREFEQAQQGQAEVTHKVIIRYRKDIDKSMIIKLNNRRFDISYIMNIDEENKYLELQCLESI
ncbi:phage head closure protein [Clostridium formicaceticum]|uniref:Phage head-tail joining protein n=1 Tax=Clostridium formicaceticum TaxID=1497 RepID=A0AAC9RI11_9CLOT|nr:phage head closure protein [Clostridium formicaceticum]AOY76915.1 hypothetical protein BJL90_14255 [Clostridium formicaceticum]ARE87394.1 Phage head-tail joining protein [Clostridium formicaceticum]